MNRRWRNGIYGVAGAIVLSTIAALVWSATWRMASANQDFREGRTDKAASVYQEMAVDQPRSPYILHNVGLAEYRKGQFSKALTSIQKAVRNLTDQKNLATADLFKIYYHSGGAAFKTASSSPNQVNAYQEALQSYKKAIEADPADRDAKYNYELTLLRSKESQKQQQQQEQNQNQGKNPDSKNSKDSGKGNPNQQQNSNRNSSGNKQPQTNNSSQNPQKQQSGNGAQPKNGQMTRQEAEALLQMAEHGDQFQAPVVKGDSGNPEKDW